MTSGTRIQHASICSVVRWKATINTLGTGRHTNAVIITSAEEGSVRMRCRPYLISQKPGVARESIQYGKNTYFWDL